MMARSAFGQAPAVPGLEQGVSINKSGNVELHVEDVPLGTVLRMLSLEGQRNIVTSPKVQGSVTANLYGVSFEQALKAVLTPLGAGFLSSGGFIYIYTNEELADMASAASSTNTRIYMLNYVSALDAKTYITPVLGEGETVAVSPQAESGLAGDDKTGIGNASASQDFIIVSAAPSTLREVERILKEVDVRPPQILIEATILRAELRDENALGIDFTVVGGVDLELLGSTSNLIESVTTGDLPTSRFEQFNAGAATGFTNDVPNGGLQLGIVKDNVAMFLQALEQITDTTVLANPKVLALNKQKGYVIVGRRDGYLTTTVTETQAIQAVEFLETGTRLVFRPFVSNDGFVRVELHPEDSVGFVNAQGLPSKQTTEVTTNIIVRDGDTILIGGLFREVTTAAKKQVPGLGSLPGVGALFRSREDSSGREEVIILLTIRVVKDLTDYSDESRARMEDLERLRVGSRQGLMWHGRGRLAQSQYDRAQKALESGDEKKALWHVNLALSMDSRMLPAVKLKEQLTGHHEWEDPGGAGGRGFIHRLIAKELGYADLTAAPAAKP